MFWDKIYKDKFLRRQIVITLEDVKKNKEVQVLINGAQKQLDELRLYRTFI